MEEKRDINFEMRIHVTRHGMGWDELKASVYSDLPQEISITTDPHNSEEEQEILLHRNEARKLAKWLLFVTEDMTDGG